MVLKFLLCWEFRIVLEIDSDFFDKEVTVFFYSVIVIIACLFRVIKDGLIKLCVWFYY